MTFVGCGSGTVSTTVQSTTVNTETTTNETTTAEALSTVTTTNQINEIEGIDLNNLEYVRWFGRTLYNDTENL